MESGLLNRNRKRRCSVQGWVFRPASFSLLCFTCGLSFVQNSSFRSIAITCSTIEASTRTSTLMRKVDFDEVSRFRV